MYGGLPKRTTFVHQDASNLMFFKSPPTTPSVRAAGDVRQHALPIRLVYKMKLHYILFRQPPTYTPPLGLRVVFSVPYYSNFR